MCFDSQYSLGLFGWRLSWASANSVWPCFFKIFSNLLLDLFGGIFLFFDSCSCSVAFSSPAELFLGSLPPSSFLLFSFDLAFFDSPSSPSPFCCCGDFRFLPVLGLRLLFDLLLFTTTNFGVFTAAALFCALHDDSTVSDCCCPPFETIFLRSSQTCPFTSGQ